MRNAGRAVLTAVGGTVAAVRVEFSFGESPGILMRRVPSLFLALMAAFGLWAGMAWAQTPPATVDPSRIPAPAPPRLARDAAPLPELEVPVTGAPPAGADRTEVFLHSVTLEGGTVFAGDAFDDLSAPLINRRVNLSEIYALAQAITQRYRAEGYLLARIVIPPQDVTEGRLRLQAVEGRIGQFTIETEQEDVREALTPLAERLVAVQPLTAAALERYLLLMNDLPGISVRSVLAPAPESQGAAVITLIATRKRSTAAAGIDTYGNAYLGPERLSGNMLVNGILDGQDSLALAALSAPDHAELAYGSVGYRRRLGAEGTLLGINASKARTRPSLPLDLGGLLRPEGEAVNTGITLQHPLIRSRRLTVSLDGALEASRNTTTYAPGLGMLETQDDQRILGGGTTVTMADELRGFSQLQLGFRKGLDIMGASKPGDFGLSRPLGDPQFFKVTGEASRYQALYGPFSFLLGGIGQWSNDALLASEQFGVGGPRYGRGFDASEITGDRGWAGKAELIFQPDLGTDLSEWLGTPQGVQPLSNLQLFVFYDGGMVWNAERMPGQPVRESLTSTGLGSRFTLMERVSGEAFLALPLTNEISSRALDKQDDWRLQFSLNATLW